MTQEELKGYQDIAELKELLLSLKGKKFTLDCGHHLTIGHHLGNNIMIRNGKELRVICSLCAY